MSVTSIELFTRLFVIQFITKLKLIEPLINDRYQIFVIEKLLRYCGFRTILISK